MILTWLLAIFKRATLLAERLVVYAYVLENGEVVFRQDYGTMGKEQILLDRPDNARFVIARYPGKDEWVAADVHRGWQQERTYTDKDAAVVATVMRATKDD